jgi:hypothetical protein
MSKPWPLTALVGMLALAAACGGGSGSTGLIDSEGAAIDRARQNGTCVESNGAAFCATNSPNATAPGGQRASVVLPSPTPVASATPAASGVHASPTAAPTAEPTVSPAPPPRMVQVVVEGFGPDAACAVAARAAGSDDPWRTGPLTALADSPEPTTFTLPSAVEEPSEVVLLCFAPAPSVLAAELAVLAESDPTVVFVLSGAEQRERRG